MTRNLIAILARDRALGRRLADDLRLAWLGRSAPPIEVRPIEDDPADATPAPSLLVVLVDGSVDSAAAETTIDRLLELERPLLVLGELERGVDDRVRFAGGMTIGRETETTAIAGLAAGLLHRQPEIDRLSREVAVAERCQSGLQSEMARLHEELQLATMVQRDHLPRELPDLLGVELGVLYRPAHYVSGDIYDAVRIDEDHIGVFLADVVGHGVPAALLTMGIARSLHVKEIVGRAYRIVEPSEVLERLNQDMLRRRGDTTRFATAVYATIDCRSRQIRLASAGHPPALLCRADGSLDTLETTGGLLGVFEDEHYGQVEAELGVDDTMLLYSDGFEQAFPSPEVADPRMPSTRYLDVFRSLAGTDSMSELVDRVSVLVDRQAGSLHQRDDLTLICVRGHRLRAGEPTIAPAAVIEAGGHDDAAVATATADRT